MNLSRCGTGRRQSAIRTVSFSRSVFSGLSTTASSGFEARFDPRQCVGGRRHLDRPLVDEFVVADDPDVVVAVLLEDRRLGNEQERAARVAAVGRLGCGRK